MRRTAASLFAAMIVLACLATKISADDEDQVKVAAAEARLMFDGQVVATVKKGERLTVVSRKGEWIGVKLTRGGRLIVGWISRKDVAEIEDPAAEAERQKWEIPPELKDREWKWKRCPAGKKPVLVLPKDWDEASQTPPDRQFDKVQDAIGAAEDGEEVVLRPGRYVECIDFKGKAITVRSTDPGDPKAVAATVLDGAKKGAVVTFQKDEGYGSVLAGVTVTGGTGAPKIHTGGTKPALSGGGVLCWRAAPVIKNCVITRNEAEVGSGIAIVGAAPYVEDCMIRENTCAPAGSGPGIGGGICSSDGAHPTIRRCSILRNRAAGGGGIYSFQGNMTIVNSVICRNYAVHHEGGIAYYNWYDPIKVTNCVIAFNRAGQCLDGAAADGLATHDRDPETFTNCIVWGNGEDLGNCHASYSCVRNVVLSMKARAEAPVCKGNIQLNPHFVDADNDDYHLQPWSPCIGAGLGGVNMGAYPDTPAKKSPDADNDGVPDAWELNYARDLKTFGAGDADSDGVSDLEEYQQGTHPLRPSSLIHVRVDADPKLADGTKEHPFSAIQPAIDAAAEHAEVRVAAGIYKGNVELISKTLTLSGGWNKDFTERKTFEPGLRTVITGPGPCLSITGGNRPSITGFTITGGGAIYGGGVYCGRESAPTLSECLIWGNSAAWGGGLFSFRGASVTLQNCVIAHNKTSMPEEGPDWMNRGGGIGACGDSLLTLINCTIVGNSANNGGGIDLANLCRGRVENCIFWDNKGPWGAHIALDNLDNDEGKGAQLDIRRSLLPGGPRPVFARQGCVVRQGDGMLAADPQFVDPNGPDGNPETAEDNDYRLKPGSPAIGAGDPAAAPPLDADGKPRMKPSPDGKTKGSCNMGAF